MVVARRPSEQGRAFWKGTPGPPGGHRWPLEQFLSDLETARDASRRELTKQWVATRYSHSKTTVNDCLRDAGVFWPFPAKEHLLFAADVDTGALLWTSKSLQEFLGRPQQELTGKIAREVLHPGCELRQLHPELTTIHAALRSSELEQAQFTTYWQRHDGAWLKIAARFAYGPVYHNWFLDGIMEAVVASPETNDAKSNISHFTMNGSSSLTPFVVGGNSSAFLNVDQTHILLAHRLPTPTITFNPERGELSLNTVVRVQSTEELFAQWQCIKCGAGHNQPANPSCSNPGWHTPQA
jgi:hypothetical protein